MAGRRLSSNGLPRPGLPGAVHHLRTMGSIVAALATMGLAACDRTPEPPATDVLSTFETGAQRPDVLVALPVGSATGDASRIVVGHHRDRYLIAGSSVEVLWVQRHDTGNLEGLERHDANPVIFRDDRLDGWGWAHFDARAEEWGIRDRLVPEIQAPAEFAPEPTMEPAPDTTRPPADTTPGTGID